MHKKQQKRPEQAKYSSLQTKFLLGLGAILLFFAALASTTIYYFQMKSLEDDAYQKSELVMTAMAANRSYVREVLRPKMYTLLGEDEFLLEAMSSSYISRSVMERFNEELYDFIYRRVALNARNPEYEANDREVAMIDYFIDNPAIEEWNGIVEKGDSRYFMRYRPVYAEQSCTNCHGDPQDAPEEIITQYGGERGFNQEVGKIYGLISVGLPIDLNLQKIKEMTLTVFTGVIPSILFLYAIITLFFNRVVAQNLNNLLNIFRTSLEVEERPAAPPSPGEEALDEIDELTESARQMALGLQQKRDQLEQSAAKVLRSKEILQSVFDGITDPVVLINSLGRIRNVNKAFLDRYSLTLDQVLEKAISDLPLKVCCPLLACGELLQAPPEKPTSTQVTIDSGEIFLIYFYPIYDEHKNAGSTVCYVKDITEQKQLEAKIQQTEKIVSMGQMAAGVAHEINNPLGVILCHTELIKDDPNLSPETKADIDIIEKHADSCRTIIADLLDFARQHKSVKEEASINAVLQDVAPILANQLQKRNITIDLDLDTTVPPINIDVDKMKQVVFNLVINSAQAIEEDGYILLYSRYNRTDKTIVVTVEDNGPGMNTETIEKIFDPFFTTKDPGQGTGLGLSVSYGIVKDHQGDITVESSLGKGTRFVVTLHIPEIVNG